MAWQLDCARWNTMFRKELRDKRNVEKLFGVMKEKRLHGNMLLFHEHFKGMEEYAKCIADSMASILATIKKFNCESVVWKALYTLSNSGIKEISKALCNHYREYLDAAVAYERRSCLLASSLFGPDSFGEDFWKSVGEDEKRRMGQIFEERCDTALKD